MFDVFWVVGLVLMFVVYGLVMCYVVCKDSIVIFFFWIGIIGVFVLMFIGIWYWEFMIVIDWVWMIILCIIGCFVYFMLIKVYEVVEVSVV